MRKLAYWDEKYTEAESLDILRDLAYLSSQEAGQWGPHISYCVAREDYAEMVNHPAISYEGSFTPDQIRQLAYARQGYACFSKLDFLDIGIDKRKAAYDAYMGYEAACKTTNDIFRLRADGQFMFRPVVERVLDAAREDISRAIGSVPGLSSLKLRFGPGATTRIKKREASIRRKLETKLDCSEDLLPLLPELLEEMPQFSTLHAFRRYVVFNGRTIPVSTKARLRLKEGMGEEWSSVPVALSRGMLGFVLKNAKILRPVEKQPVLNGMLQLAYGDHLAKDLKRSGLDLSDQTINQGLAREGSLTGALATLDLKGASDCIAYLAVMDLLDIDWFTALAACRVGTIIDPLTGKDIVLEKFSAMGNGFTFPLQSLIFWALTRAAVRESGGNPAQVNTFGDDIICPSDCVPLVTEVLTAVGFIINTDKSYWTGPFRESCGADFVSGTNIRPVYIKEAISPALLFTMHNGFKERGMDRLAKFCEGLIAPHLRLYGPRGYGDGHLHSDAYPRTRKSAHLARGYEGSIFKTFVRVEKHDIRPESAGDCLLPSYLCYMRASAPLVERSVNLKLGSFETLRKLKKQPAFMRLNLEGFFDVEEPSSPLPEIRVSDDPSVEPVKGTTFPGYSGVKIVSVYTLGV